MNVAAAARFDDIVDSFLGEHHLPECPHARGIGRARCDWCRWAVVTPALTALVDIGTDAGRLVRSDVADTVPGVVAAGRLFELFAAIDLADIDVASARQLAERVRGDTERRLDDLERRVQRATRPGGPIDRRCLRTAGALATAMLQAGAEPEVAAALPPAVRGGFEELTRTISGGVQLSSLMPMVEHLHWHGMPALETQPEWSRRRAPGDERELRQRQLAATGVQAGSLEALVLESVIDRCTELLLDLGPGLADATEPLGYQRPVTDLPFDGRLRSTLWRILPIDWHLTLIDTGLAACWETNEVHGVRSTTVPWVVHVAAGALRKNGFGSALFHDPPQAATITAMPPGVDPGSMREPWFSHADPYGSR